MRRANQKTKPSAAQRMLGLLTGTPMAQGLGNLVQRARVGNATRRVPGAGRRTQNADPGVDQFCYVWCTEKQGKSESECNAQCAIRSARPQRATLRRARPRGHVHLTYNAGASRIGNVAATTRAQCFIHRQPCPAGTEQCVLGYKGHFEFGCRDARKSPGVRSRPSGKLARRMRARNVGARRLGAPTSTRKVRVCKPQMYCKKWYQGADGVWLCAETGSRCIWV